MYFEPYGLDTYQFSWQQISIYYLVYITLPFFLTAMMARRRRYAYLLLPKSNSIALIAIFHSAPKVHSQWEQAPLADILLGI